MDTKYKSPIPVYEPFFVNGDLVRFDPDHDGNGELEGIDYTEVYTVMEAHEGRKPETWGCTVSLVGFGHRRFVSARFILVDGNGNIVDRVPVYGGL